MSSLGTVDMHGGRDTYNFDSYAIDTVFNNVAAVYAFTKAVRNADGVTWHTVIYVGQTDALGARIANHEKWPCVRSHGANRICILLESSKERRLSIEEDLIKNQQPVCNEALKGVRW